MITKDALLSSIAAKYIVETSIVLATQFKKSQDMITLYTLNKAQNSYFLIKNIL